MKTTSKIVLAALGVLGVSAASVAGWTQPMPKSTNETPTNPDYAELAGTFCNPFGKVRTGCYWYWMAGNVSCEGVRKDLEAMKRAGIDRAYIGDIGGGGNKPGPVKTFSPEWEKALATAFETASRLDIEIGIFNSPGWSQSGGPWVKPEMAMRRVVASMTTVDGPTSGVKLPAPKFECAPAADMRDVCAVAYPAPDGFTDRLEAKDVNDSLLQRKGKPLVVELESKTLFTAQSAELAFIDGTVAGRVKVEAQGDGGAWRTLCDMPFSRVNHGVGVGFSPHAPVITSFAPTTAKRFRVTVNANPKHQSRFASVAVCGAPLVARAYEKSLAKMHETPLPMWPEYQWPDDPANVIGTALDPAKAVVLTGKVAPDGTLDWQVPSGKWVIYRFGAAPTGTKNGPANPEATGYEVDKMSREHVATHFDAYLGKILARTPPEHRKAIRHAVLDSYEQGGQNYTDNFAVKFKASFGYDPTPYLPALSGMSVGSRDDANRFLWDLRRFIADEVAYSYVGGLRDASNAHGMRTWLECYGHWGFPGEFLQYGGQSDGIAGEYWSSGSLGDIENRAASSCGHIYGKRQIWAESNTCGGPAFGRAPADMKGRTDRFFAEGINASILHLYIHQAYERAPGITAWFGNEFNRHNTWFKEMDIFTAYLKRCGYMLQQGLNVADIAYFIGEDAPKMTGIADPAPPRGRQFDYINGEVLRETAFVDEDGRLSLPHGTKYEVLVLPKLTTMRPELLLRIEQLVNDGAFVIGPKPRRSPSLAGQPQSDALVKTVADRLWGEVGEECKAGNTRERSRLSRPKFARRGKGVIAWGLTLEEALAMRGSATDCGFAKGVPIAYNHRTMKNADVYFISNQSSKRIAEPVSFRVAGRIPELWQAVTGERREAPVWQQQGKRTEVMMTLEPLESVFVVFAKPVGQPPRDRRAAATATTRELKCDWTLSFESDPLHRGPAKPLAMSALTDLTKSADPAVKYYSGTVVYRTKFTAAKPAPGARVVLSFGSVREIARVKVNGRVAGGMWTAPYEVPVTDLLKDGENTLEVEVATSWVNRLVGDAALPAAQRPTWISTGGYKPTSALRPSGLVGPVFLRVAADSGR